VEDLLLGEEALGGPQLHPVAMAPLIEAGGHPDQLPLLVQGVAAPPEEGQGLEEPVPSAGPVVQGPSGPGRQVEPPEAGGLEGRAVQRLGGQLQGAHPPGLEFLDVPGPVRPRRRRTEGRGQRQGDRSKGHGPGSAEVHGGPGGAPHEEGEPGHDREQRGGDGKQHQGLSPHGVSGAIIELVRELETPATTLSHVIQQESGRSAMWFIVQGR
jgi:hypothetical protein